MDEEAGDAEEESESELELLEEYCCWMKRREEVAGMLTTDWIGAGGTWTTGAVDTAGAMFIGTWKGGGVSGTS